jgi:hypothetical protein
MNTIKIKILVGVNEAGLVFVAFDHDAEKNEKELRGEVLDWLEGEVRFSWVTAEVPLPEAPETDTIEGKVTDA